MDQYSVGRFIAKLRKEKNLTQRDLAEKLGITNQAVSKWERGENLPDISILMELAKIFNVTVDELLKGNRESEIANSVFEKNKDSNKEPISKLKNIKKSSNIENNHKLWISVAIALFVISPISFFLFNSSIAKFSLFFTIIGIATGIIIYKSPAEHSNCEDDPKLQTLTSIIYSSATIIFFVIGYLFKTYRTAWLVFLLATLLVQIIKYRYSKN